MHGHMRADLLQVLELVEATLMVDAHWLILELASLPKLWVAVLLLLKPDAWGEGGKLETKLRTTSTTHNTTNKIKNTSNNIIIKL